LLFQISCTMGQGASSDGCRDVLCEHDDQKDFGRGRGVTVQPMRYTAGPANIPAPITLIVGGTQAAPGLSVPKAIPAIELSKPLTYDQRRELADLQQHIKAQLARQEVLADSVHVIGDPSPGAVQRRLDGVVRQTAVIRSTGGPRSGPSPDGDLPVLDLEADPSEESVAQARMIEDEPVARVASRQEPPPEVVIVSVSPRPPPKPATASRRPRGVRPPGREQRRWIEAAVRRMFRALSPIALDEIVEGFREWRLPSSFAIVQQGSSIASGPGLCVLFEGVVDVLHLPKGGSERDKVCTYDRLGQCFGELELLYDAPRGGGPGRKAHWATIATRTPATLWTVDREVLKGVVTAAALEGPTPPNQPAQEPRCEKAPTSQDRGLF